MLGILNVQNPLKVYLLSLARVHHNMKARIRRTLTIVTRGLSRTFRGPISHLNHKLLSTILAPCQVCFGGGSMFDMTGGLYEYRLCSSSGLGWE